MGQLIGVAITNVYFLPFRGGMGPVSLSVVGGVASFGFRMLKPRTGPPMPIPGEGLPGVIWVGFLVGPDPAASGLPLIGVLLLVSDDVSLVLEGNA
jgi:hypothetical protein